MKQTDAERAPQYELRAAGVPPPQEKRGAQRGATQCSPVLFHREYPRERS
jgi:hypothetical protein